VKTYARIGTKPDRDRAAETFEAKSNLVGKAIGLRHYREAEGIAQPVMQIAQAFIVCCPLPYTRTSETRIERTARMGDGSRVTVILSAVSDAEMAFGSDRTLLYWLFNKAIKLKSRFIPLRYVSEYLDDMGLTHCGKNRKDFVERLARVSGIFICVNRVDKLGKKVGVMLPMFRSYRLPAAFEWGDKQTPIDFKPDEPMGVEFSEEFFADLFTHPVPVPMDFIKATRKQSQVQDLGNFITYRGYKAKNESFIPYSEMMQQVWHADKTERRLKVRLREVKAVLKLISPETDFDIEDGGIRIRPNRKELLLKA
jgi:Plasmid encoded RepA protein